MAGIRELMRRRLLEEMYDRLSPEQKRAFVQLSMLDKNHQEILQALQRLERKADEKHHSFISDFGANVAGNAVWDGLIWLGSKIFKKL